MTGRSAPGSLRVLLVVLVALIAVACASPRPTDTSTPSTSTPTVQASPETASAPPTLGPSGALIAIDPNLLHVLPPQVDGLPLTPDPATAADVSTDADLARSASAIAVALAIAPGASTADDLAVVSVVKLRPGVFGDAFFRNWRDTYDRAACAVAGGITGHASAIIGGRETEIGTCAAGAHTYHVHLATSDILVSITAAGPRRLGELVVAGLTE